MFLFSLNFKQVYSLQLGQSKNVSRHCVSPWSRRNCPPFSAASANPVSLGKKKNALVELKKKCNITSKHRIIRRKEQ